uniref:Uncharacterized protein n=1 Tax=Avena sativa TaxID=4498 RepID=A0ACD5Z6F3_AVESA
MTCINRRGMECDTRCFCCKRLDEDGAHLFLKCKEMKQLWNEAGLQEMRERMSTFDIAQDVVEEILTLCDEKKVFIFYMLWQWWQRRNKQNREGKSLSTATIWRQAKYWTEECLMFCWGKGQEKEAKPVARWQKPPGDVLKINTDGAFNAETRQGGWGFVIRDAAGEARGSRAGASRHAFSALQMEVQACSEALHATAQWGMENVSIKIDSSILVQALQSRDYNLAPEGVIFRDIGAFNLLKFSTVEVSYDPRSCNKVAHLLAAYGARLQADRMLWPEYVLEDVRALVASESAEPI